MAEKDIAEAFARSLAAGVVSTAEAVAWVDDRIAKRDTATEPWIEASLARNRNDLISWLHRIPGQPDSRRVARLEFGHMRRALKHDPGAIYDVARCLFRMAVEERFPHPEAEGEMYYFDDALELARRGTFGDESAIRRELECFLDLYSEAAV